MHSRSGHKLLIVDRERGGSRRGGGPHPASQSCRSRSAAPTPAPPPSSVVPDAARPVRSVEVPGRRRTRSRSPAAASGLHPMSRVGSAAGGSIWLASGVRRRPGASGTARERPGASWSRRLGLVRRACGNARARQPTGVVRDRAIRVFGVFFARMVGNHACARHSRMWFRFFS